MDVLVKKESFHFENGESAGAVNLIIATELGEKITFECCNGHWRYAGQAMCVSPSRVASVLFGCTEETSRSNGWMTDYIRNLEEMMSVFSESTNCQQSSIEKPVKQEKQSTRLKDYARRYSFDAPQSPMFVYLMKHRNGLVKIGRSVNPKAREKTLQAEDPQLNMVFCCESTKAVEKRLHKIFHSLRVRGEWFSLDKHHVDWIQFVLKPKSQRRVKVS